MSVNFSKPFHRDWDGPISCSGRCLSTSSSSTANADAQQAVSPLFLLCLMWPIRLHSLQWRPIILPSDSRPICAAAPPEPRTTRASGFLLCLTWDHHLLAYLQPVPVACSMEIWHLCVGPVITAPGCTTFQTAMAIDIYTGRPVIQESVKGRNISM
jgi:hypothetical protein